MHIILRPLLCLLAAILVPVASAAQAPPAAPTGQFLHLSDIHFDPFAEPALVSQLSAAPVDQWEAILQGSAQNPETDNKQDSNYALIVSALKEAKTAGNYDYIIYTGDYLSHRFMRNVSDYISDPAAQKAYAAKSAAFVNWMIAKHFPGTPLIATLGNNDSNCGDYSLTPGGDIMPTVETGLPIIANDASARADFEAGGYYRTPHPTVANVDFLVLSVFWADGWWNKCPLSGVDPRTAQMQWLSSKLADAKQNGRRAIILMHIPPGMDAFSAYKAKAPAATMWTGNNKMLAQFQALATQYKAQLVDGFAGHTHMDEFRVIADTAPIMAIRMGPSVTPYNGNRPAFTAFNYDTRDGSATDYTVSSYDPTNGWTTYKSFTALYGAKRYNAATLQRIAGLILSDAGTRGLFANYYAAGNSTPAAGSNYRYFACALTALSTQPYGNCLKSKTARMRR